MFIPLRYLKLSAPIEKNLKEIQGSRVGAAAVTVSKALWRFSLIFILCRRHRRSGWIASRLSVAQGVCLLLPRHPRAPQGRRVKSWAPSLPSQTPHNGNIGPTGRAQGWIATFPSTSFWFLMVGMGTWNSPKMWPSSMLSAQRFFLCSMQYLCENTWILELLCLTRHW